MGTPRAGIMPIEHVNIHSRYLARRLAEEVLAWNNFPSYRIVYVEGIKSHDYPPRVLYKGEFKIVENLNYGKRYGHKAEERRLLDFREEERFYAGEDSSGRPCTYHDVDNNIFFLVFTDGEEPVLSAEWRRDIRNWEIISTSLNIS